MKKKADLIILPECYANECVARMLKMKLRDFSINVEVSHNYKHGRDRIVQDLDKLASKVGNAITLLALIDYEKGIARFYIDKNFELHRLEGHNGILLGRYHRKRNVLAIVLDPNIEEALLCKVEERLCKDPEMFEQIKSRSACKVIFPLTERQEFSNILQQMANKIVSMLGLQHDP